MWAILLCLFLVGGRAFRSRSPPRARNSFSKLGAAATSTKQLVVVLDSATSQSYFKTKPLQEPVEWSAVFEHMATKMGWEAENGRFNSSLGTLGFEVVTLDSLLGGSGNHQSLPSPESCPIVMMVGLKDSSPAKVALAQQITGNRACVAAFDCAAPFQSLEVFSSTKVASEDESRGLLSRLLGWVIGFGRGESEDLKGPKATADLVKEVWTRRSSDDLLFLMLVLINRYFAPFSGKLSTVVAATSAAKTGLNELSCMCCKCGKELFGCVSDPLCKKALDCLEKCRSNDQVCSYRCITSYESEKFEKFSQCILQRNNCLGNSAKIPLTPDPAPLNTFRGQPLSFETSEAIFEGHLKPRPGETNALLPTAQEPVSWMVVTGVNPAYDQFSDQHQIFYRERNRRSIMWYDPVFKVETLDGQQVWRRRHYRVRRGQSPGQFRLTVLDNGVLSDEFWRVLDCDDQLEWGVFYYSGAAAAAGTSYTGALIVTRDGDWPRDMRDASSETHRRISEALARGGINLWEVYEVSNTLRTGKNLAGQPPLGIL